MNLAFVWQVCEILNPEIIISGDCILNMKSLALLRTRCEDKHEGESDQSEEDRGSNASLANNTSTIKSKRPVVYVWTYLQEVRT